MRPQPFRPDPTGLPPLGHRRAGWDAGGRPWRSSGAARRGDLLTVVVVTFYVALAVTLLLVGLGHRPAGCVPPIGCGEPR